MTVGAVLAEIDELLGAIEPHDTTEHEHLDDARAWLATTDDVFRRMSRPVAPRKHLVSYFVPTDPSDGRVLLGEHRKSGLWLPPGGHVEPGEHPVDTVRRECVEELGIEARLAPALGERPLFLTVTETRAPQADRHTDVSLWFVLELSSSETLTPDPREYRSVHWWSADEIRAADPTRFDPHQVRMLDKLAASNRTRH